MKNALKNDIQKESNWMATSAIKIKSYRTIRTSIEYLNDYGPVDGSIQNHMASYKNHLTIFL